MNRVTSFEYVIANNAGVPGILSAVANSPADLVILGGGSYQLVLDRSVADANGKKLIFGYIDVADAAPFEEPHLFSGPLGPEIYAKAAINGAEKPVGIGLAMRLLLAGSG